MKYNAIKQKVKLDAVYAKKLQSFRRHDLLATQNSRGRNKALRLTPKLRGVNSTNFSTRGFKNKFLSCQV